MAEEAAHALERARAVRGGHRGVVTKLVLEADEIISATTETLDNTRWGRFSVIQQQLSGKLE